MKAAAVMMQYDYGEQKRGYSYEYINIFLPLEKVLGKGNVLLFDFYSEFKNSGKESMNKKLSEFIAAEKPDIALFCLFENEFEENVLQGLKDKTNTVAYFFDDPWRREFAAYWRKFFSYATTPDYYTYLGYMNQGLTNIIYCPFGYNAEIYKKLDLPKKYDVSFVGGYSPYRKWIIEQVKKSGIKISVFGRGWDKHWLSQEEMVQIFNQSKINLNLSNAISYDYRMFFSAIKSPKDIKDLLLLKKNKEQVKGRHYEINGCGGFQLSYFVPGLNRVFEIDKEIAVYESIENLPDEINFFLSDNNLREEIAEAGYKRSLRDHKAENYLKTLIDRVTIK